MKLPSITLCLDRLDYFLAVNATLKTSLVNCSIGGVECDHDDFYSFETRTCYNNKVLICHVLNGGRNSSGHLSEIKNIRTTGPFSGFKLQFYLPKYHYFYYYINDAYVKPTTSEINKYFPRGTTNDFIFEKTVETKLENPFNNCWNRIDLPGTPLVKQLSEANITYRQVNCFELCLQDYVRKYASEHKISEDKARETKEVKNYDMEKNCNKLLVSNLGGSFGLFLDLSFLSACRAIEFLLGIIFKY